MNKCLDKLPPEFLTYYQTIPIPERIWANPSLSVIFALYDIFLFPVEISIEIIQFCAFTLDITNHFRNN